MQLAYVYTVSETMNMCHQPQMARMNVLLCSLIAIKINNGATQRMVNEVIEVRHGSFDDI